MPLITSTQEAEAGEDHHRLGLQSENLSEKAKDILYYYLWPGYGYVVWGFLFWLIFMYTCGGQRTTWEGWFTSSSGSWVLNSVPESWLQAPFNLLSHLASP